jgi:hypothetical protein
MHPHHRSPLNLVAVTIALVGGLGELLALQAARARERLRRALPRA